MACPAKARGIQARIAAQFPAAVYVHFRNHALDCALYYKVRDVRYCLDTVQLIMNFNTASPKRLQCFMANNRNKKRLQRFSDTRWYQHDLFAVCLLSLINTRTNHKIKLKSEGDSKCSSKATSHTRPMESFDCIICLVRGLPWDVAFDRYISAAHLFLEF